ncbi:MAG: ATP-binding protein [Candidatus Hadarchaeales archaeon]
MGEEDPTYERWKSYKIKWIPSVIDRIPLKPFSLNFLVGPRQVGKTTALKICIQNLIKERDPKSVFYYSCDELSDHHELGEIIDNYLAAREEWGIKGSILFLDEITFVEDWWRALKFRIDQEVFSRDVLVVTGSASIELLGEKERFPGRRGHGKDLYFYPLDFAEYVQKLGRVNTKLAPVEKIESVIKSMKANVLYASRISELFKRYLETGGFPLPVRELFEDGKVSTESKKTCLDWLRSDWKKAGKSDGYMKGVIRARLSPVSWLGIAKETSIGSPHTAQSYVECLQDLLAVKVLEIISPDFRVMHRKNKKIHVLDPFLYRVFSYYTGEEVLEETVVESVVVSHLTRVFDTYFWKDGSEIDVISIIGKEQVGFEVKWGPKSWRKPRHLKRAYLLSREELPLFLSSAIWHA